MEELFFLLSEVLPDVEAYRKRQVNKFYREKELEWGGEPVKMERYKHRVRVIDLFLPAVKKMLVKKSFITVTDEDVAERDIP